MSVISLHILRTKEADPSPDLGIVIKSFGEITVATGDARFVTGEHIYFTGEVESIKEWLRPYDDIWIGQGSPMLQDFNIGHVK